VAEEELRQQNDALAVANEKIAAERQRYVDLFELAPDGYIVTDAVGTIREANRAALLLLGVTRSFAVGKPLVIFTSPGRRREMRLVLARMAKGRRIRDWDFVFQPRQAPPIVVSVSVDTQPTESGRVELRWMLRDVTERRRL